MTNNSDDKLKSGCPSVPTSSWRPLRPPDFVLCAFSTQTRWPTHIHLPSKRNRWVSKHLTCERCMRAVEKYENTCPDSPRNTAKLSPRASTERTLPTGRSLGVVMILLLFVMIGPKKRLCMIRLTITYKWEIWFHFSGKVVKSEFWSIYCANHAREVVVILMMSVIMFDDFDKDNEK